MAQKLIDIGGGKYVPAEIDLVTDVTGQYVFSPDSLAQALTYTVNGDVATLTVGPDLNGDSFRQTYTYNADATPKLIGISAWVKV